MKYFKRTFYEMPPKFPKFGRIEDFGKSLSLSSEFSHYLAGAIEGDGNIFVPKNNKRNPSIRIAYNLDDLELAKLIKNKIGHGSIYFVKGVHICNLTFDSLECLLIIINLINGKFRGPKINKLYEAIDFINNKYAFNIPKLPIDNSHIKNNSWLTGFIDTDGSLFLEIQKTSRRVGFLLQQVEINQLNLSNLTLMTKISNDLNIKLTKIPEKITETRNNHAALKIKSTGINNNDTIMKYLDKFPLLSSKYLNFLNWKEAVIMIQNHEHLTTDGKIRFLELKNSMNSKRTYFDWKHLDNNIYFK